MTVANEIRAKLHATYIDYAEQAERRGRGEAATAYRIAAGLALGTVVTLGHESDNSSLCGPQNPNGRDTLDGGDGQAGV
jgi:hypothetical protein